MTTFVSAVHIVVCLLMIVIILVFQQGKGADAGAAFGGTSQAMFGGRGAATFMNKLTTIAAIVFMLTSLSLAALSSKNAQETVFDDDPAASELQHPDSGEKAGVSAEQGMKTDSEDKKSETNASIPAASKEATPKESDNSVPESPASP